MCIKTVNGARFVAAGDGVDKDNEISVSPSLDYAYAFSTLFNHRHGAQSQLHQATADERAHSIVASMLVAYTDNKDARALCQDRV